MDNRRSHKVVGREPCAPDTNLNQMKTLRRYHLPEDTCLVTNVTFKRNPILIQNIDLFWQAVSATKAKTEFEFVAWVILPDHCHLIVNPHGHDISAIMQRIKMSFGATYRKRHGLRQARVWQNRFWDRIVRNEDDLRRFTDYIHWNPVKHGWVKSPFQWKHSSVFNYYPKEDWQYDVELLGKHEGADFGE